MTPDALRRCLADCSWTQAEFGRRLGVSPRQVRYWCSGAERVPPVVALWMTLMARFHREHPSPARYVERNPVFARPMCSDCPPFDYPHKTRCESCPRHNQQENRP